MGTNKEGVGLIVELPGDTTVKEIRVQLPASGGSQNLEFYAADRRSMRDATRIGAIDDGNGARSVPVRNPVAGRYLIVWVTKTAQESDGKYRARIIEITLFS